LGQARTAGRAWWDSLTAEERDAYQTRSLDEWWHSLSLKRRAFVRWKVEQDTAEWLKSQHRRREASTIREAGPGLFERDIPPLDQPEEWEGLLNET
jgi:hypothetical protein